MYLEGGYSLPSLSESAALTLRCLLGDPCPPPRDTGPVADHVWDSIRSAVVHLAPYWTCLKLWDIDNMPPPDLRHETPDVALTPVPQDQATKDYWSNQVAEVMKSLDLRKTKYRQANSL